MITIVLALGFHSVWYVPRFTYDNKNPSMLMRVGHITMGYILCTLIPNHHASLTLQGCTAVSIDTCTALVKFIGLFFNPNPDG